MTLVQRTAVIKGDHFPTELSHILKTKILVMKTGVVDINTGSNSSP